MIYLIRGTENYPAFQVDYRQRRKEGDEKAATVAETFFEGVSQLASSVQQGLYEGWSNAYSSFLYIVVGWNGTIVAPAFSLTPVVFKVIYWAASLLYNSYITAAHSFFSHYLTNQLYLTLFAPPSIDVSHIETTPIEIDMDGVPEEVKVRDLISLFEGINFDDPNAPGYIASLPENETAQNLKRYLATFVDHIERRVPFLGTPPADKESSLSRFYQQIEDAVRASLHAVQSKVQAFEKDHNTERLDEEQLRRYKGLKEDLSRLVVDLAIAGKHCGTRYNGEALEAYFRYCSNKGLLNGNLEDILKRHFGRMRKELVDRLAQEYIKEGGIDSAHQYTQYMETMGPLLGIPGTAHIVEHLAGRLENVPQHLQKFFKLYTEESMIEYIQKQIINPPEEENPSPDGEERECVQGRFREIIFNWLKDHRGQWAPNKHAEIQNELEKIIQEDSDTTQFKEALVFLIECLECVDESTLFKAYAEEQKESYDKNIDVPESIEAIGWSEFIQQFFAQDKVKEKVFLGQEQVEGKLTKKYDLTKLRETKALLLDPLFGKVLYEAYRSGKLDQLGEELVTIAKVKAMRKVAPIPEETYERILKGEADLQEAVVSYQGQDNDISFLNALSLENIAQEGLPPAILEWLLVENQIFHPQKGREEAETELTKDQALSLLRSLNGEDKVLLAQTLHQDAPILDPSMKKRRYIGVFKDDPSYAVSYLMEKAYAQDKSSILNAIEEHNIPGANGLTLKEITWMKATKFGENFFNNFLVKLAATAYVLYKVRQVLTSFSDSASTLSNRIYKHYKSLHPHTRAPFKKVYQTATHLFIALHQRITPYSGALFALHFLSHIARLLRPDLLDFHPPKPLKILHDLISFFVIQDIFSRYGLYLNTIAMLTDLSLRYHPNLLSAIFLSFFSQIGQYSITDHETSTLFNWATVGWKGSEYLSQLCKTAHQKAEGEYHERMRQQVVPLLIKAWDVRVQQLKSSQARESV